MIKLEVGTVIYSNNGFNNNLSRFVITRVTPKRAYAKVTDTYEIEFDRDVEYVFSKRNRHRYDFTQYFVENDEMKMAYYKQCIEHKLSKVDFKNLTIEKLERILTIISE